MLVVMISVVGTEARSGVASSSVLVIIRCWQSSAFLQTARVRLFEGHGPWMESATASTETSVEKHLTTVVLRSAEAQPVAPKEQRCLGQTAVGKAE